ncbi:MAG: DegT/DnrJ/EryC1/StrS family aminotransferase [Candidatus Neomarinimicrobiota bacterium]
MIPFHKPNIPDDLEEIFSESIRQGWLTTGSRVDEFENILSSYLEAKYVIVVNSCTAALHLALAAKGFGKNDKFISPTLTFAATVECGEYLGMEPILVDADKDGFLIDLNQVEDILKRDNSIKAIIPVHYAGESVDLNHLWSLAEKYNLFILEDAAHALEASIGKIKVGNTNFAAAFSFYANKNITTAGEGGALATNNPDLANKVKQLSLHGITKDGWNRYKTKGNWEYDIVELGYKYNLTDFAANYGIWQMGKINHWRNRRLELFQQYIDGLSCINNIVLPKINNGHAMHLFVIQLINDSWSISRDELINKMNKKGIGLAVHYKPIHKLSYYKKKYAFDSNHFLRANMLFKSIISLPIYPTLSNDSVKYIIDSLIELSQLYSK